MTGHERLEDDAPGPERVIMHLDMDAFFASVEQLDNPELRGKPVIVGGSGPRGVVSAASYEARKFGVRSAMPGVTARRLCPQGIFVRGRMRRYSEASKQVMAVLRARVPVVQQTSVDEAYIDATGTGRLEGSPGELAARLKAEILAATGLTCSVGVAPNKFLAKIASDMDKPDGLTVIEPVQVPEFLHSLPVNKIPGVGPRSAAALARLNIKTVADIQRYPEEFWVERFGKWGKALFERGHGRDDRPVASGRGAKSSSSEVTFSTDIGDRAELKDWLWRQAERVGRDLRRHGWYGRTVTLKVRLADFSLRTRSRTLPRPTNRTRTIFDTACALLDAMTLPDKVRLIGVGMSNFDSGDDQLALLPQAVGPEADPLDVAVDAIREKFGDGVLVPGRSLKTKK